MKLFPSFFALLTGASLSLSCAAQNEPFKPLPLRPSTLFQTDFEQGAAWLQGDRATLGTIDVAGSTLPSRGLMARETISSGPLLLQNTETGLGKLTLAFSLSASAGRPVLVKVESFDKAKRRTGGLETTIYPAAPDFYQRFALELSNFKAFGRGKFSPTAPFVGFSFAVDAPNWKGIANPQIRLDNVQFAKPAFYVSPSGDDKNDGRTEKTAFARPQKALDVAQGGDIIVVMNGTYTPNGLQEGIASFERPGTPAGWISLKNYPGQQPIFSAVGTWNAIKIGTYNKETPYTGPARAYLEVRGIHVRGDSDVAKEKYAEFIGQADPRTNGNGISIEARTSSNKPHHIRFADNVIEFCSGGGISSIQGDWITAENNICRNNCWWMIYAGSGISFLGAPNFDGTKNTYRMLIRNNICSGNRTFIPWAAIKKISDGNGIILDSNEGFTGRMLIQSNLSFNNGGSGIHAFKSPRIDIINNTAYYNGASPELRWGQIFLQSSPDSRVFNNILVSRADQPVNTVSKNSNDQGNPGVVRAGNLYFGGNTAPIMGEGDKIAAPMFVQAAEDASVANFHLQVGSPALGSAKILPFSPFLDLDGKPRGVSPTVGAYQH